jgi:hypothetical protein
MRTEPTMDFTEDETLPSPDAEKRRQSADYAGAYRIAEQSLVDAATRQADADLRWAREVSDGETFTTEGDVLCFLTARKKALYGTLPQSMTHRLPVTAYQLWCGLTQVAS